MGSAADIIPVSTPIVDKTGKAVLSWVLFFQSLLQGDQGTTFVPNIISLGETGTPTISGVYYQNDGFADFYVRIVPATNTSSTAGTTYFTLPFTVTSDCPCFAVTGNSGSIGGIVAATNQVFPPAWTNFTTPITISGRVPIQ